MSVRPAIIESEDDFVAMMRGRRLALGWGQAELDEKIGWSPAYVSKIEAPHRSYGRRCIWGITKIVSEWAQGLGLALVLMDRAEALKLCAESVAAPIDEARAGAYPNRHRDGGLVAEQRLRLTMTFRRAA